MLRPVADLDDLVARVSAAGAPAVRSERRHPAFKDMTGVRVGRLRVVDLAPAVCGNARWRCVCDCGKRVIVEGIRLRVALKRRKDLCCPDCRTAARG